MPCALCPVLRAPYSERVDRWVETCSGMAFVTYARGSSMCALVAELRQWYDGGARGLDLVNGVALFVFLSLVSYILVWFGVFGL